MAESYTWREQLGGIINNALEKQRMATALGVNPATLTRWVAGLSNPRIENLHQLVKACRTSSPQLSTFIAKEFPGFTTEDDAFSEDIPTEIPRALYADILHLRARTPKVLRFWTICTRIIAHMAEALDLQSVGIVVVIAQCTAPVEGNSVRSLHKIMGRGTPPWDRDLTNFPVFFLGAESLSGYAASLGHIVSLQNQDENLYPVYKLAELGSMVSCPVESASRIAGCLNIACTQPTYFQPAHLGLIESYAQLMAIAFEEEAFYEPERLQLCVMPPQEVQSHYFSTFQKRVRQELSKAARGQQSLTRAHAEQLVWQQLEEEIAQRLRQGHSERGEQDGEWLFQRN